MSSTKRHRNATYGLIAGLRSVLRKGQRLTIRGYDVLELRNHITIIDKPLERCIVTPQRNNNIFATVAETAWVLAGRNDLAYLHQYLPRAGDFSDDGQTWRAAYGPRLRNWHGVDQLKEVLRLFQNDAYTRRAVMAIFDPSVDYQESKDIPCNNWLHWMIRDNRLNLSIALRSNDAIWGFSGINSFEWSVLQEVLAHWAGVSVGDTTFFAGSFHVYERHHGRAEAIVQAFPNTTWYEMGSASPHFMTTPNNFDKMLKKWFAIESMVRVTPRRANDKISRFPDPLFRQFLALLQIYNGLLQGWDDICLADYLSQLPENDLTAAASEYLNRKRPAILHYTTGHPTIKYWLSTQQQKSAS